MEKNKLIMIFRIALNYPSIIFIHIKKVPRCSNISAHVRYSPKALANLSVAAFICCKSDRT